MENCWNIDPLARPTVDEIVHQLNRTSIEDDRPAEREATDFRACFHSSVGGHSDILGVHQLEALIFETESAAFDSTQSLSQLMYVPDHVIPDSLHDLRALQPSFQDNMVVERNLTGNPRPFWWDTSQHSEMNGSHSLIYY